MSEYTRPNGFTITDRRYSARGLPAVGDDGRLDTTPNATPPGGDQHIDPAPPYPSFSPISVGPNASAGYGNSHVMYPAAGAGYQPWGPGGPGIVPSAWSGWPVDWTPPWSGGNSGFLGQWGKLVDVIFAALDLNSSIIASMPPYLVKGAMPQEDQPWILNPEPEVYVSWNAFAKEALWSLVACGEVFVYATARYADSNGGRPARFMVVNPAFVNVDRVEGEVEYSIGGEVVDPDDILHIKYVSWPGDLHGHGPLEVAGARVLAVQAMLGYMTNQAASPIPPVVLRHPKRLNRAQMAQMQQDYVQARASGMGLPAILSDGTELDILAPQLKDITISEAEKFSEARLATLLGVPPFLLGLPTGDSSTYVNSTNVFDFHWRAFLRPRAEQFARALGAWALPHLWRLELNRDDYIRPGEMERAQAYTMLIGAGVLTPDEVRVKERYVTRLGISGVDDVPIVGEGKSQPPSPADASPVGGPREPIAHAQDGTPLFGKPGRHTITNTQPTT